MNHSGSRPVSLAHLCTSGQFHAGRPPTVQRGSGSSFLCRQMSTVGRCTPKRSAISVMPTGSHSFTWVTVGKVLTPVYGCVDNHYMAPATTTHNRGESPRKESTMDTTTSEFLAARAEWVALGRPTDHPYARRCAEVAAKASPPAVGVRCGDTYKVFEL